MKTWAPNSAAASMPRRKKSAACFLTPASSLTRLSEPVRAEQNVASKPAPATARRISAAGKPSKSKREISMPSKPIARSLSSNGKCARSKEAVHSSVLTPNFIG